MKFNQVFIPENNLSKQVEAELEYNPWKDYIPPPLPEPVNELTSEIEEKSNPEEINPAALVAKAESDVFRVNQLWNNEPDLHPEPLDFEQPPVFLKPLKENADIGVVARQILAKLI